MFSFVDDTVVDPFCGTGTTMVASMKTGRNSIGIEFDPEYCKMSEDRLRRENNDMFLSANLEFIYPGQEKGVRTAVGEKRLKYSAKSKKISR